MQKLSTLWRHLFDVRAGELGRTVPMCFYLFLVMFAYYILKPVSRGMFLTKFELDKLPWLYILIAFFGGILAYFYSKLAARTSLSTAVFWSMLLSVLCLVAIWYLLSIRVPAPPPKKGMIAKYQWMIYVFNVWVSLFSVTLVAQGWLVASNMFNAREAKRLYGLLGIALVIGAWSGGEFTHWVVKYTGTTNLLLAAAVLVILAYVAFRVAAVQKGVSLSAVRAGDDEEAHFSMRDMVADVVRTRHLQVIVSIMVMIFIVDSLVDFQFQAMAQSRYEGDELTAFLGRFHGTYLNLTEFIFQFFLTGLIVGRFGVGGTMNVMPVAVCLSSVGTALMPTLITAGIARLTEASTRYSLNRTGLELLYMPLSVELRNRVKAFIDIFVDRFSRGIGGILLLLMFKLSSDDEVSRMVRMVAIVAIVLTMPWVWLTLRARKEYVATIRKRLATRQLDLESTRVTVEDAETLALLERTAAGSNPRQAAYALELLGTAAGYDLKPQLLALATSSHSAVRAKVFELARRVAVSDLRQQAFDEVGESDPAVVPAAVAYVLAISDDRNQLAREWMDSPNPILAGVALEGIDRDQIAQDWIESAASDPAAARRALAAKALGLTGDQGSEALHKLLNDADPKVVAAACRAAGAIRSRSYIHDLVWLLPNPHLRGEAVAALAAYGPRICGSLGDILEDRTVAARIRRHIPRVLKHIADQRSVDVLLKATIHSEPAIRDMAIKALNRLRTNAPRLHFEQGFITPQIMTEARSYFELNAALAPLRDANHAGVTASLLRRSLEERLHRTLDRLFRLLALQYPPKEIYSAFLAVQRRRADELSAALEFLDNVVEREVKRILIPLVDAPSHLAQRGKELYGIEPRSTEAALRELMQSGDPWLAPCAQAAATELNLRRALA
jgi:ATP:ADP antiporter, AAA family